MEGQVTPPSVNSTARQITQAEVQRFLHDAWQGMQMRLAPGRLANDSYNRVDAHAVQNRADLLREAKKEIFTNYQHAVELQADAYYRSVKDLMFQPATATQGTFDPLYLTWQVEHPVVAKRRKLVREQQLGLGKVAEKAFDPTELAKRNELADAKAKADKENQAAIKEIERLVAGLVFQGPRGNYDYPKMDSAKAELRAFVKENLKADNAAKILVEVKGRIAQAHLKNERANETWLSR